MASAVLLSGFFGATPKNTKPSAVGSLRARERASAMISAVRSESA
jgi:hypothetical protein